MTPSESRKLPSKPDQWIPWVVSVVILLLWSEVTLRYFAWWPIATAPGWTSTLTDYYEALNVLVALLGFCAVLWTIHNQNRETARQKTEDHFFQLLAIWHASTLETEFNNRKGGLAFLEMEKVFVEDEEYLNWKTRSAQGPKPAAKERDEIVKLFRRFYEQHVGASMAHILRMTKSLVVLLDDSDQLPESQKMRLISIFQAMLSDPELHLLLYYGLSDLSQGLDRLIDKYELLFPLCDKPEPLIPAEILYYPATLAQCQSKGKMKPTVVPEK